MTRNTPTHATLDDWIAREAIPFSLEADDTFNAAVDEMLAALGGAVELLGVGEALHGGQDILTFRNRLFQRLAEAHGYSAIAIESSFPRGHAVNEYAAGRGPAAYDAVQEAGFSHGFGRLAANRKLVEWMRAYNADPAHRVKLRFYGFDSPTEMGPTDSPRKLLYFVLEYLAGVDSAGIQEQRQRIAGLLGEDAAWEDPAALADPAQAAGLSPEAAALRIETEELIAKLRARRPEWIARSSADRYREAEHYAASARQLLNYHAALARPAGDRTAKLLGMRDAMMADNLAYMAARERGRGKVLAFAHNSHLKRGKAEWQLGPDLLTWYPAGAHLAALLNYAVIGTALGVSEANGIGQPETGTLEARLTAGPGPARLIPTHQGKGLPAEAVAALPMRTASAKNPTYFALTPQSLADFDWLAVLDSTAYTIGGPELP